MNEMYFSFGALADKFSEQCENQGYKLKNYKGKKQSQGVGKRHSYRVLFQ